MAIERSRDREQQNSYEKGNFRSLLRYSELKYTAVFAFTQLFLLFQ